MFKILLITILMTGCSFKTVKECKHPACNDGRFEQLQNLYAEKLQRAQEIKDQTNSWITPNSCDGMLWSGKYGTVDCSFDPTASEREPGLFGRRPIPCWSDGENNGAKTTWSRDMSIGLLAWAIECKNVDVLKRHRDYGRKHNWIMGKPLQDGRVIYTPQIVDMLMDTIAYLDGDDDYSKIIPIWPSGLTGYEAHLQMMSIWIRKHYEPVNDLMYRRILEHASREPNNPFYSLMAAFYDGGLDETINLLIDPEMPMSSYVRCEDTEGCRLAEWLFVSKQVLERLGHE